MGIDLDDWEWHYPKAGDRQRKFLTTCDKCGKSRGYIAKYSYTKSVLCKSCGALKRWEGDVLDGVKNSPVDLEDKQLRKTGRGIGTYYRTTCAVCGVDRGYQTRMHARKYPLCYECGVPRGLDLDTRTHTEGAKARPYSNAEAIQRITECRGEGLFGFDRFNYVNNKGYVELYCLKTKKYFEVRFDSINRDGRKGCPCHECRTARTNEGNTLTTEEFITRVVAVWGQNVFDFTDTEYLGARYSVKLTCLSCGTTFKKIAAHITDGNGCTKCHLKSSKGESRIIDFLYDNDILYQHEYMFDDCKGTKRRLPFDFYIPAFNTCIEFDGEQHYREVKWWGGKEQFDKLRKNDAIKTAYCKDNNIKLLRIPHTDFKRIPEILEQALLH
jgi:hypothetical protein